MDIEVSGDERGTRIRHVVDLGSNPIGCGNGLVEGENVGDDGETGTGVAGEVVMVVDTGLVATLSVSPSASPLLTLDGSTT